MADVFVSYSHADKAFVERLVAALEAAGLAVWVDSRGLSPSLEWWQSIQQGIRRANNVLFLISPGSMSSPVCHMELELARQLSKRVIPVMHDDFEREACTTAIAQRLVRPDQAALAGLWAPRQVHRLYEENSQALNLIQYFFFSEKDDFAGKVARLADLIRADFAHKAAHTRWGERAFRWAEQGRDLGLLLVESELQEAGEWLDGADGKDPAPSAVQREFIQASRQADSEKVMRRRQQLLASAGSGIGAGLAIGGARRRGPGSAGEESDQPADDKAAFADLPGHLPASLADQPDPMRAPPPRDDSRQRGADAPSADRLFPALPDELPDNLPVGDIYDFMQAAANRYTGEDDAAADDVDADPADGLADDLY